MSVNSAVWSIGSPTVITSSGTVSVLWALGGVVLFHESASGAETISVSGSVQAQAATGNGSLGVIVSASGDVQSQSASATGALGAIVEVSGAIQSQASTGTGDLAAIDSLSGDVQTQASTATGNLGVIISFNGAVQAQSAIADGNLSIVDGVAYLSGNVQAQAALTTGTVGVIIDLNGSIQAQTASADGNLNVSAGVSNLSGDVQAQASTTTGTLVGPNDDCIVAQITADRKATLSAITTAGGAYTFTPAVVEEPRIVRNINGRYPYMEITKAPIEPEDENNVSEHTKISYLVTYEDQYNDDDPASEEILYHFRNVNADIIKAWMADRTCGGLAEITRTVWYDDAVVNENGLNFYRSAVIFEVETLIDSANHYLKG
jgi:hypothetical protein